MSTRVQLSHAREPNRRSYLYREVAMFGVRQLKDADILAAVLSGDLRRRRAVAERLLLELGSLWAVARLGLRGLRELGLGQGEAARVEACVELGRRALAEPLPRSGVNEPRDAYRCVAREHGRAWPDTRARLRPSYSS